jgi:hypothetical protein
MPKSNIVDRFKRHWLPSILVLCCAVVGATWAGEYQAFVLPRDLQIHNLESELAKKNGQIESLAKIPTTVLERTWLNDGGSSSCSDGSCFIRVDGIRQLDTGRLGVELSVTVAAEQQPRKFRNVASGTRLPVATPEAMYSVDINEIEITRVGIDVTRQLIFKPCPK